MFAPLAPDTVLQNRYRIKTRLDKPNVDGKGKGGMGAVYLAEDSYLSSKVAIKQTVFDSNDSELAKAFQREAQLLANLRHHALPRVSNHFSEGNGLFLVMDLIHGEDLDEVRLGYGGRLPLELALQLADQLLEVLDYLHSQNPSVIHRDIKPSNLKLSENGQLILLDFGLAKGSLGLMTQPNRSLFAMTPAYAPPEQMKGEITEPRSDLFSFGATFYELLSGQKPPHALEKRAFEIAMKNPDPLRPLQELNPAVPMEISQIFMQTLSLKKESRPQSASVLREMLRSNDLRSEATTISQNQKAQFLIEPSERIRFIASYTFWYSIITVPIPIILVLLTSIRVPFGNEIGKNNYVHVPYVGAFELMGLIIIVVNLCQIILLNRSAKSTRVKKFLAKLGFTF